MNPHLLFSLMLTLLLAPCALSQYAATGSNTHSRFPAKLSCDMDFRSGWESKKPGSQTLTVDLGQAQQVSGFVYIPYLNKKNGRVSKYRMETSLDGKSWKKSIEGSFTSPRQVSIWPDSKDQIHRLQLKQAQKMRWYRLHILSTEGNAPARLNELQPIIVGKKEPFAGVSLAELKGQRYAPSIHLNYRVPRADVYYNEITVTESAPGSFFMGIGYNQGYFGIQEHTAGRKWLIFSIWDDRSHDRNAQTEEKRAQIVYMDENTRSQRFGNEGSGRQSFYDYDWKVGEKIKLMLKIEDKGERRHYSGYFYHNTLKKWILMTKYSSIAPQPFLTRFHSFVEDFRRNYDSFGRHRSLKIDQAWARDLEGKWHYVTDCTFTRDSNPNTNITAFTQENSFNFGTGGKVKKETKPRTKLQRPVQRQAPQGLPL